MSTKSRDQYVHTSSASWQSLRIIVTVPARSQCSCFGLSQCLVGCQCLAALGISVRLCSSSGFGLENALWVDCRQLSKLSMLHNDSSSITLLTEAHLTITAAAAAVSWTRSKKACAYVPSNAVLTPSSYSLCARGPELEWC